MRICCVVVRWSAIGLFVLFLLPSRIAISQLVKSGDHLVEERPVPAWDVISVRENKQEGKIVRFDFTSDGYRATGVTLKMLIASAFNVRTDLVYGTPKWADAMRFNIDARVSAEDVSKLKDLSKDKKNRMLLNLLKERFGFKGHQETKELPVYDLVVAKGGPKLKPAAEGKSYGAISGMPDMSTKGVSMIGPGLYIGNAVTITAFANAISLEVERNVFDKTGIQGHYDIDLKYASQRMSASTGHTDNGGDADADISIFTAIEEEMGLKLQASKGPVATAVVDHADLPSEN